MFKPDPHAQRQRIMNLKPELQLRKEKIFKEYQHGAINLENLDVDDLRGFPILRLSPAAKSGLEKSGILVSGPMINLSRNPRLTSLKGLQSQVFDLAANSCGFTDMLTFPPIVNGSVYAQSNQITHLKGIGKDYLRHVYGTINLVDCPITENILGLMRIVGLTNVMLGMSDPTHPLHTTLIHVSSVINRYLRKTSPDLLECKEKLMDAGYKEYARL